jgi:cytochrome c-type biogenesis protein CcmE
LSDAASYVAPNNQKRESYAAWGVVNVTPSVDVETAVPLPDLFREGQGVVAEGTLDAVGHFRADTVLAKHDETYMPPEVAKALKEQGVWQGGAKATEPGRKQP